MTGLREWLEGYFARHKERTAKPNVHNKANVFVRAAGVVKPVCVCGHPKVHMHHEDYSRPLEVAFLCARCHRAHHLGRLTSPLEVHDLRWLAVADVVAFA